jgi:hypothetical protein
MPQFQLEIAAVLVAGVLSSSLFFAASYRNAKKEGKIKLPTYSDSDDVATDDPFNVIQPEDIAEGEPLNERQFWTWVSILN